MDGPHFDDLGPSRFCLTTIMRMRTRRHSGFSGKSRGGDAPAARTSGEGARNFLKMAFDGLDSVAPLTAVLFALRPLRTHYNTEDRRISAAHDFAVLTPDTLARALGGSLARAVQRSAQKFIEKKDLRPPSAAA